MSAFVTHHLPSVTSRRSLRTAVALSPSSFTPLRVALHPPRRARRHRPPLRATAATPAPATGPRKPDSVPIASPTHALKEFLQGVWQLSRPLWSGRRRGVAWMWTLATIVLAFAATMYAVGLSMIQKLFWNVMSTRDISQFGRMMRLYGAAVVVGPIILALFEWVKERLALMWRRALTEHLLGGYFDRLNYYKLSSGEGDIDNPDQRMSEDVMRFTTRAVRFMTVIGVAFFDCAVFSVILYRVYKPLLYLLILYAAFGTVLISGYGRNLLRLNKQQVTKEGDFRYNLVRVRESTESIAFYAGEGSERAELLKRFGLAFANNISLLGLKRNVYFLSSSFRYYAQVAPTAVIAPQYFAGKVLMGTISQVIFSYNHVLSSLGLAVSEFSALSEFAAGVRRLKGMADALEPAVRPPGMTSITTTFNMQDDAKDLLLSNLTVQTPSDPPRPLVRNLNLEVKGGERLLVVGRSGVGKSSLMRAVCGLWDSGAGHITRPTPKNTLFLPQKPFVMLGTLKDNVVYPSKEDDISDAEAMDALRRVNLGYLLERDDGLFTAGETLSRRLSLGEQQRLAFARILISKPTLVILDESTSALDLDNENAVFRTIQEMNATCISVGNRPSLIDFHDKVLRIEENGTWRIETPEGTREFLRLESLRL